MFAVSQVSIHVIISIGTLSCRYEGKKIVTLLYLQKLFLHSLRNIMLIFLINLLTKSNAYTSKSNIIIQKYQITRRRKVIEIHICFMLLQRSETSPMDRLNKSRRTGRRFYLGLELVTLIKLGKSQQVYYNLINNK